MSHRYFLLSALCLSQLVTALPSNAAIMGGVRAATNSARIERHFVQRRPKTAWKRRLGHCRSCNILKVGRKTNARAHALLQGTPGRKVSSNRFSALLQGKQKGRKQRTKIAHSIQASKRQNSNFRQFVWGVPSLMQTPMTKEQRSAIAAQFYAGNAGHHSPALLTNSGVFVSQPMRGGIYKRRQQVQYIIVHSTETARPANGPRVIASWSNRGLRHPGAQFVVDRDGTIYSTVDPQYATVHVDTRRTITGINNDNTIGIEIVHTGAQKYTPVQMRAVSCLVAYLQNRYNVSDDRIQSHHHVQPSDRSDPVNFDWQTFELAKSQLGGNQTAWVRR